MDNRKRSPMIAAGLFIGCAITDFCWGYLHNGSVGEGVFSAVLGVIGTTIFFKTMLRRV